MPDATPLNVTHKEYYLFVDRQLQDTSIDMKAVSLYLHETHSLHIYKDEDNCYEVILSMRTISMNMYF